MEMIDRLKIRAFDLAQDIVAMNQELVEVKKAIHSEEAKQSKEPDNEETDDSTDGAGGNDGAG